MIFSPKNLYMEKFNRDLQQYDANLDRGNLQVTIDKQKALWKKMCDFSDVWNHEQMKSAIARMKNYNEKIKELTPKPQNETE